MSVNCGASVTDTFTVSVVGDPTSLSRTVNCADVDFSWTNPSGNAAATSYNLEYKETSAGAWTSASPTDTLTSHTLNSLPNGTYEWRLTGSKATCNSNVVTGGNFTITASMTPPTLTNESITCSQVTFNWTAGAGSTEILRVYDDAGCTNMVHEKTSATTGYTGELSNGNYYWKVFTSDGTCEVGSSSRGPFNVNGILDATSLAVSTTACNTSVDFSWVNSGGSTTFSLEYSTDGTFGTGVTTVPINRYINNT